MCRSKKLGGARCPSHNDPVKVAAYNKLRRERYAAKNLKENKSAEPPFKGFVYDPNYVAPPVKEPEVFSGRGFIIPTPVPKPPVTDDPDYALFPDIDSSRYGFDSQSSEWEEFTSSRDAFKKKLEDNNTLLHNPYVIALQGYTDDDYRTIRDYLNGYKIERETAPNDKRQALQGLEAEAMEKQIALLDEAVALAEKPEKYRKLYRGMRLPRYVENEDANQWIDEHFPMGEVVSQKSYMSTSYNAHKAAHVFTMGPGSHAVLFEILSKDGAVLGQGTSILGDKESEVLMPRNKKFRVVAVHHDVNLKVQETSDTVPEVPESVYHHVKRHSGTFIQLIDESE